VLAQDDTTPRGQTEHNNRKQSKLGAAPKCREDDERVARQCDVGFYRHGVSG